MWLLRPQVNKVQNYNPYVFIETWYFLHNNIFILFMLFSHHCCWPSLVKSDDNLHLHCCRPEFIHYKLLPVCPKKVVQHYLSASRRQEKVFCCLSRVLLEVVCASVCETCNFHGEIEEKYLPFILYAVYMYVLNHILVWDRGNVPLKSDLNLYICGYAISMEKQKKNICQLFNLLFDQMLNTTAFFLNGCLILDGANSLLGTNF